MKKYILISSLIFVAHAAFGMQAPSAAAAAAAVDSLRTPQKTRSVRRYPIPQTSPGTKLATSTRMFTTLQRGLQVTPKRGAALERARLCAEKALQKRDPDRAAQIRQETRGINPDGYYDPEESRWFTRSPEEARAKINGCHIGGNNALWQAAHQDPASVAPTEARAVIEELAQHDLSTLKRRTQAQKRKIDPAQSSIVGFTRRAAPEQSLSQNSDPQILSAPAAAAASQAREQAAKKPAAKKRRTVLEKAAQGSQKIDSFFQRETT